MELLEHELLETKASEDKNKKIKMVTLMLLCFLVKKSMCTNNQNDSKEYS